MGDSQLNKEDGLVETELHFVAAVGKLCFKR